MENNQSMVCKMRSVVLGVTAAMGLFAVAACSSEQPKAMVQPTSDQVRGHADRAFDKLKQEEQERAAQPPMPR